MNQRWIIWQWTYKDKNVMMSETCEANNMSHYHNECPNDFPINVSQWRNGLSWNRLTHSMQWFRSLCPMKCDGNNFWNQYTGPNHLPMCCPTIPEQNSPVSPIYLNCGKTQFPVISCVCLCFSLDSAMIQPTEIISHCLNDFPWENKNCWFFRAWCNHYT